MAVKRPQLMESFLNFCTGVAILIGAIGFMLMVVGMFWRGSR